MKRTFLFSLCLFIVSIASAQRYSQPLMKEWKFFLGDDSLAHEPDYNDRNWRVLSLPHDWSIEGSFSKDHPATTGGGALPTGIGWYRKEFSLPDSLKQKKVYINFDGVQRNSEVWINGHYLGKRPNGYSSFRYELTPWLKFGKSVKNILSVRADNSAQPSSRWYTGSGIYRKVWLEATNATAFSHWGVFVTTPSVSKTSATIRVQAEVSTPSSSGLSLQVLVYDASGRNMANKKFAVKTLADNDRVVEELTIQNPRLWSPASPYLYKVVTRLLKANKVVDEETTVTGIRWMRFDPQLGFFLNGQLLRILGVCNHHDLGALGAAVNKSAIRRQLLILKKMGTNAIRTAHNPPAQELLELCDEMGFLVMNEAFDMWKKRKNRQDYHLEFEEWSRRDLEDLVRRDRNHPSVFSWSIGNEIREQFDSTGITITRELVSIVKSLDTTRPVTCALTENFPEKNFIYQSGALDLLGFNYKLADYPQLPVRFPGQSFIATETSSALATRGHYDMPSDSNRLWPPDGKTPYATGNPDLTVSAYDHVYAYWGSTHEAGWNAVKKYPFMAGIFVWSGFDFLGEPVPYPWPARSSYYGLIDLAGFPKDAFYMYQSEWTPGPMLHLFPHWNWEPGKLVDVWAYYNGADEVELFLNGRSLGTHRKTGDSLHVMWRVPFAPGMLKAVSRNKGKTVLTREIRTAGRASRIILEADRKQLLAANDDLSFITVKVVDAAGNLVPDADAEIGFSILGNGYVAGVDNGLPTSMESFKASKRKAWKGKCLVIVGEKDKKGKLIVQANSPGLRGAVLVLDVQ